MTNIIKHRAIVESVEGTHVRVKILQTSACSTCNAKGYCSSSESKEKIVDIYNSTQSYEIGEEVMIYGTTSMGMQAVLIAFVLPFILLIAILFILMSVTRGDELNSAIGALCALIPYYIIVYLFRNRLKKNFTFTLKPLK